MGSSIDVLNGTVAVGHRHWFVRETGPRDRAEQLKEDVSGVSNYSSDVGDM